MFNTNLILSCDSYKGGHFKMMPPNTEYVYSYIESRGGAFAHTVFFGLQMFLKTVLSKPITQENIEEAEAFFLAHGEPFNRVGWEHVLKEHGGYLPLRIKAVPEGSVIPTKNVLVTVVNTDPKCFWLTSYIETMLLRAVWFPTTVCTLSFQGKLTILEALKISSDDPWGQISFKMHDFGQRGVSSSESAAIGGAAHLVNFMGSDTVEGILAANHFYHCPMSAFSIPAAEHSTITAWGKDNEIDAFRCMLTQFAKPGALVAVVSDSFDLWRAVNEYWGDTLRQEVIDSGATIVVRPDSGIVTEVPIKVVDGLAQRYGFTINSKGYRVLPSRENGTPIIRVIQGDGCHIIPENTIETILQNLLAAGYSADNLNFGMGGGLLQEVTRDTLKFAMKCSAVWINGEYREVYKDPVTDPGKASKKGMLGLRESGEYKTVPLGDLYPSEDILKVVYKCDKIGPIFPVDHTFDEVRARADATAKRLYEIL